MSLKLVGNSLKAECLIQKLQWAQEAKMEHDRARDEYTGYSWGYHGAYLVGKMESTAAEFEAAFLEYIQDAVKEAIASK